MTGAYYLILVLITHYYNMLVKIRKYFKEKVGHESAILHTIIRPRVQVGHQSGRLLQAIRLVFALRLRISIPRWIP